MTLLYILCILLRMGSRCTYVYHPEIQMQCTSRATNNKLEGFWLYAYACSRTESVPWLRYEARSSPPARRSSGLASAVTWRPRAPCAFGYSGCSRAQLATRAAFELGSFLGNNRANRLLSINQSKLHNAMPPGAARVCTRRSAHPHKRVGPVTARAFSNRPSLSLRLTFLSFQVQRSTSRQGLFLELRSRISCLHLL